MSYFRTNRQGATTAYEPGYNTAGNPYYDQPNSQDYSRGAYNDPYQQGNTYNYNTNVINTNNDYAMRGGSKLVRGYSDPNITTIPVTQEPVTVDRTVQYTYHGPFRRPISAYSTCAAMTLIFGTIMFAVFIVGVVFWAIEANKTCIGLDKCENIVMLDIGVAFSLGAGILFCSAYALWLALFRLKVAD